MSAHGIVPALASMAVALADLRPHPANPNLGDVGAIAVQMQRHGQTKPIVVQEGTGLILAGNHRHAAAGMLGWTHIAALRVDVDEHEALRILVGDNLPARGSRDDEEQLVRVLSVIATSGGASLAGAGYDAQELAELIARTGLVVDLPSTTEWPEPEGTGGDVSSAPDEHWPTLRIDADHRTHRAWNDALASVDGDAPALIASLLDAAA